MCWWDGIMRVRPVQVVGDRERAVARPVFQPGLQIVERAAFEDRQPQTQELRHGNLPGAPATAPSADIFLEGQRAAAVDPGDLALELDRGIALEVERQLQARNDERLEYGAGK